MIQSANKALLNSHVKLFKLIPFTFNFFFFDKVGLCLDKYKNKPTPLYP